MTIFLQKKHSNTSRASITKPIIPHNFPNSSISGATSSPQMNVKKTSNDHIEPWVPLARVALPSRHSNEGLFESQPPFCPRTWRMWNCAKAIKISEPRHVHACSHMRTSSKYHESGGISKNGKNNVKKLHRRDRRDISALKLRIKSPISTTPCYMRGGICSKI